MNFATKTAFLIGLLFIAACSSSRNTIRQTQDGSSSVADATSSVGLVQSWREYRNDEYGFSFEYPSDWVTDPYYKDITKDRTFGPPAMLQANKEWEKDLFGYSGSTYPSVTVNYAHDLTQFVELMRPDPSSGEVVAYQDHAYEKYKDISSVLADPAFRAFKSINDVQKTTIYGQQAWHIITGISYVTPQVRGNPENFHLVEHNGSYYMISDTSLPYMKNFVFLR